MSQKFAVYKPTSQILVASKTTFTTSTGTTLQDTGVSYTIPSDGIYCVTASLTYGTGMPTEISIVNSANEGMVYDRAVPPTGMNVMGLTAQTLIAASSGTVKVRAKFEIANASAPISLIVEKIG